MAVPGGCFCAHTWVPTWTTSVFSAVLGQSLLLESLSRLRVMFSQLVFGIHAGKFIVDWARHFLSFSPTLTTEVSAPTGGLVRNSTGEDCFSKADPTEKNTSVECVVGSRSTFGLISHIKCYYLCSRCVINKAGCGRATDVVTVGCWEMNKIILPAARTSSYKPLVTIERATGRHMGAKISFRF